MRMKQIISIFFPLLSLITLGCLGSCTESYSGDGIIEKIGVWPFSHGYIIDFGQIDFNCKYKDTFEIENFPNIRKTFDFGIKLITEKKELKNVIKGRLQMKAYSEDGTIFFDINKNVSEWTFHSHPLEKPFEKIFIFFFDKSQGSYIPARELKKVKKLFLNIEFDGHTTEPIVPGNVIMKVGGYK